MSRPADATAGNRSKEGGGTATGFAVAGASEGARRATGEAPATADPDGASGSGVEVVARAQRRRFSEADKQRILIAADRCTRPGELGAMLRLEGVYSSSLSQWRRQREQAQLEALAPKKRGPKVDPVARADALRIAQLTKERDRLRDQLEKAQLVIEVQKKVSELMGIALPSNPSGSDS